VFNPLAIAHLPNVMVEAYAGGNDSSVWSLLSEDDRKLYQEKKPAKSIFLCPLYPGENPCGPTVITGRPHPAQSESTVEACPRFAPEIAEAWGWTDGPNMLGASPYEESAHYNTLVLPVSFFSWFFFFSHLSFFVFRMPSGPASTWERKTSTRKDRNFQQMATLATWCSPALRLCAAVHSPRSPCLPGLAVVP
jgi:hypothetical protein